MATPENMLTNPGFEDDFAGWQVYIPDPTTSTVVIDTANFYSGAKSAKFIITGVAGGGSGFNQRIDKSRLIEGGKYRFRIKYYTNFTLRVWFYFRDINDAVITEAARLFLPPPSTPGWQTGEIEVTMTMPPGTDWSMFGTLQIIIDGSNNAPSEANVDDLEFYAEAPTMVTITFQSTPIAVTATVDGTTVSSGQAVQVQQGATVTVTVSAEVTV
jgi:hypothetical protein